MKKIFSTIICLVLSICVNAQNFQWAKSTALNVGNEIVLDKQGSIYVMGSQSITKYNANGDSLWSQHIIGTSYDIILSGVVTDDSNNVYMAGAFGHTISIGSFTLTSDAGGNSNTFLVKYSSTGVIQWVTRTHSNGDGGADDISIDNQGNVLIIGRFLDSMKIDSFIFDAPSTSQIFLAKFSSNGFCLWAKHIESTSFNGGIIGPKVKCDKIGSVYITGHFSNYFLLDSLQINAHGGSSDQDIFLAKLTQNGFPLWVKAIGGAYSESTGPMDVDSLGNIYISGYYESPTAYFDNFILTCSSPQYFTAKYSSLGNCAWVNNNYSTSLCAAHDGYYANSPTLISKFDNLGYLQWIKSVNNAVNNSMITYQNNVFLTGSFNGTAVFDLFTLNSSSNQMFIAKLGYENSASIDENENDLGLSIFPNPSSSMATIFIKSLHSKLSIILKINNSLGKTVYSDVLNEGEDRLLQIDLSAFKKGIYFVELYADQRKLVKKLVVQ
jgi:hypothetical protein